MLAKYNGDSTSGSFDYCANRNITSDRVRYLTVTYFDEKDLPKQYYKNSTNKVDYTYDAGGNKWSKTATVSGTASTTLYDGTFIYENGTLKKVLTSEGYYDPSAVLYYYYLKDHLGNTRLTFHYSGTTAVVDQEVEYYPFGSLFTENNLDKNKYLYNGKELNDEFFENYDFHARFYDSDLGRWHVADPHAEDFLDVSPYCYALNNPILFVDPDGKKVVNADEERKKRAQEKKDQAKKNLDNASPGKEQKKAQRKLDRATRQFNRANAAYEQTEQTIQDIKTNSPEIFEMLDNATDANGNVVDMQVTSAESLTANQQGAQTLWGYDPVSKTIYGPTPGQDGNRRNQVAIRLQPGTSNPDVKLVHEGGHILDIIAHPLKYWNNRGAVQQNDCRDPANRNNPYVKPAMDLEEQYINIRKGKK